MHVEWVEIVASEDELEGEPEALMRVQSIEHASRQVTLVSAAKNGVTVPEHALLVNVLPSGSGSLLVIQVACFLAIEE